MSTVATHVHGEDTPLEDMNPGIRKTVAWLRDNGFRTCDSGDGVTHQFACDRDQAYVVIRVEPYEMAAEADRLMKLLDGMGVSLLEAYEAIGDAYEAGTLTDKPEQPFLQADYNPVTGIATLDLACVSDAVLFKVLS